MNLSDYLAKWQGLTERQRDILTAVAMGYKSRYGWYLFNPRGSQHSKTYSFSHVAAWHNHCPYFTRFDSDCGAFVEVWQAAESLNWKYWRPFEYVLSDRSAGIHQWVKNPVSKMNRAEILCCAYVWARLQEEPELWEKFEEAIG